MHLAPSTAWAWLISCAVVILLFPLAAQFGNLKGKLSSFHTWVWAIALLGIVTAGFIPFTFDTDITHFEVQPFIFFITGTLLGVLFLGEFHRLSGLNKQEHTQRVHAERRTRYSKAVEQLAYPNPAVRASALSALAGLVDEWLADEQLSVETRQKEGQVIVNALCAYVRSPFARAFKADAFESDTPPANYAGDFATDLAAFRGEQDVRRSVFVEMSKRSSTLAENEKGEVAVVPGAWSGFEFDFSRAVVFYPLDGLTIENANFSAAKFSNGSDFSGVAFVGTVDFSRATFGEITGFGDATFTGDTNFTRAVFDQDARFSDVTFMGTADFSNACFAGDAVFHWVSFNANADFREASFGGYADFRDATFAADAGFSGASFEGNAGFFRSSFGGNASFFRTDFAGVTEFREAVFEGHAGFNAATFYGDAHFSRATFEGLVGFRDAAFEAGAEFYGASFVQTADFCDVSFTKSPPLFAAKNVESGEVYRARFAALSAGSGSTGQEAHNFAVYEGNHPIPLGTAGLNGVGYRIPVGAVLFDPTSWDERQKEYTRLSEPAQ
ncbi:MAG: pentapeptide repeat-containing protein [Rothia mucilaginosa]|uniref:Pentapeptide repeat-containing protein n=1 Tax=Rothia mucilaginosa TaxID=43675 RepID=A0A930L643_9MICC|nr:pentapeptide repeat-containing protein [Rothia mucilaginosa]MBF1659561.1 pentapeptide repeat-containing protein [Rothia mucilaginosa]